MIYILSREEAITFCDTVKDTSIPIISINDVGYASPIPDKFTNVLKLEFDDVTPYLVKHHLCHPYYEEEFKKREPVLFNEDMAEQVFKFITKCLVRQEHNIMIHCYKGLSRSYAVGMFLYLCYDGWFERRRRKLTEFHKKGMMNSWVFDTLIDCRDKR